ncbi:hypothetical protein ILYODFUR_037931, partial [Ilyodon furcidens]
MILVKENQEYIQNILTSGLAKKGKQAQHFLLKGVFFGEPHPNTQLCIIMISLLSSSVMLKHGAAAQSANMISAEAKKQSFIISESENGFLALAKIHAISKEASVKRSAVEVVLWRQAKRLLVQIVERCRNGPGFHGDGDGGTSVQEMLIPASKVGLVIGRGGDTIKQLQERAGVKMMMIQDGPMPTGADKPLRISGDPYKVQ